MANSFFPGFQARGLPRLSAGHPSQAGQTVEGKCVLKIFLEISDHCLKVSLDYRTSSPALATGASSSVFRMSIGGDLTNYGDQIAFIRYWDNAFWILSPINGEANWGTPIPSPPLGDWCSIEVVHQVEEGEYHRRSCTTFDKNLRSGRVLRCVGLCLRPLASSPSISHKGIDHPDNNGIGT